MKKIAITQRMLANAGYPELRDALDVRWAELCGKLNYLPVLLPNHYDFKPYFMSLKIDGIILTGGNDLSSLSPGDELSRKRDAFEKKLIMFAVRRRIPILGVCRGMQVISDCFHGKLEKVAGHVGSKHRLTVSAVSKYREILKELEAVNSYHNYGIKDLQGDFIVSARSGDGVIEAIEHKKHRIFGQMWHPERDVPFCKANLRLIREVFI